MESWLLLMAVALIAFLAKNQALMIGAGVVIVLKLIPQLHPALNALGKKGINWGVVVISAAILVPIATEQIGLKDVITTFTSPAGIIAVICGVLVAVLSRHGVELLASSPQITVALMLGTIAGVVFLRGVAAGPVIAGGMTYVLITLFNMLTTK
jgi:uncharacterized membrane protein (DUF441 family)